MNKNKYLQIKFAEIIVITKEFYKNLYNTKLSDNIIKRNFFNNYKQNNIENDSKIIDFYIDFENEKRYSMCDFKKIAR